MFIQVRWNPFMQLFSQVSIEICSNTYLHSYVKCSWKISALHENWNDFTIFCKILQYQNWFVCSQAVSCLWTDWWNNFNRPSAGLWTLLRCICDQIHAAMIGSLCICSISKLSRASAMYMSSNEGEWIEASSVAVHCLKVF